MPADLLPDVPDAPLPAAFPPYDQESVTVRNGGTTSEYVWRQPEDLTVRQRRSVLAKLLGWRSLRTNGQTLWHLGEHRGHWPDYTVSLDRLFTLVQLLEPAQLRRFTRHVMRVVGSRNARGTANFAALFFVSPVECANALVRTLSPNGVLVRVRPPLRTVAEEEPTAPVILPPADNPEGLTVL